MPDDKPKEPEVAPPPPPPPPTPRCGRCSFWQGNRNVSSAVGECHRFPPVIDRAASTGYDFPRTIGAEWCGEFAA